jgi:hypothetical protein
MSTDAPKKSRGRSHVTKLINLVLTSGAELFRSPEGDLYVTLPNGDHRETLSLTDRMMKEWLARAYFIATKSGVSGGALNDAIIALSGSARAHGIERSVYTRVAAIGKRVYLDLVRNDYQILTISADGWTVTPAPADVRFVRRRGMLPLPIPTRSDTPIADLLASIINIKKDSPDLMLLIGWLVGALRGVKPYPVLSYGGEYGSSKTYACRQTRRIIDPNEADLSSSPKEARDLMISALNSHVIGFDNLSFIPDWLSDLLCCLSTGAGFRTRALHTDATEMIFSAARPIMMNGITDMIRRGDLMDRTLAITLEPIADEQRRTEADIDAAFLRVQPGILAALADAVSHALHAPVTLTSMPRMADFATTVESAAPKLGWKPGAFLQIYAEQRVAAVEILLDNDLVAAGLETIRELRQPNKRIDGSWDGTSEDLLELITTLTPLPRQEKLPKSGKGIMGALRRLAPGLRTKRVDVQLPTKQETTGERRGQRVIKIVWKGALESDGDDAIGAHDDEFGQLVGASATGATDEIPF